MLKTLRIDGEYKTPTVVLDKENSVFEFTGASFIESTDFYDPVIEWIDTYMQNPSPETTVVFKLNYINTMSSKVLSLIMMKLAKLQQEGHRVFIKWFYEDWDEDIKESGEELASSAGLPYELIEI